MGLGKTWAHLDGDNAVKGLGLEFVVDDIACDNVEVREALGLGH